MPSGKHRLPADGDVRTDSCLRNGEQNGVTDITRNTGNPSGVADGGHASFYHHRRKRACMDCHRHRPDMYTEDQKMRSDYDDRNGYYLSGGESVPEKCDRQTQTLRSRQQCHIEDPVSF